LGTITGGKMKKSELNLQAAESIMKSDMILLKSSIEQGANVNAKCYAKKYPLISLAIMTGNTEAFKYLISKNSDVNAVQKYGSTGFSVDKALNCRNKIVLLPYNCQNFYNLSHSTLYFEF